MDHIFVKWFNHKLNNVCKTLFGEIEWRYIVSHSQNDFVAFTSNKEPGVRKWITGIEVLNLVKPSLTAVEKAQLECWIEQLDFTANAWYSIAENQKVSVEFYPMQKNLYAVKEYEDELNGLCDLLGSKLNKFILDLMDELKNDARRISSSSTPAYKDIGPVFVVETPAFKLEVLEDEPEHLDLDVGIIKNLVEGTARAFDVILELTNYEKNDEVSCIYGYSLVEQVTNKNSDQFLQLILELGEQEFGEIATDVYKAAYEQFHNKPAP